MWKCSAVDYYANGLPLSENRIPEFGSPWYTKELLQILTTTAIWQLRVFYLSSVFFIDKSSILLGKDSPSSCELDYLMLPV